MVLQELLGMGAGGLVDSPRLSLPRRLLDLALEVSQRRFVHCLLLRRTGAEDGDLFLLAKEARAKGLLQSLVLLDLQRDLVLELLKRLGRRRAFESSRVDVFKSSFKLDCGEWSGVEWSRMR